MEENLTAVTDTDFDDVVLKSEKPVLVDFWAEWCGPCRMLSPILADIARSYAGRLQIVKVNVDENHAIPERFNVRGIPALMLFKNGELVATKVGALPKGQLQAFIDSHI